VLTSDSLALLTPLVTLLLGLSGFLIGLETTRNFRQLRSTLVGLGVALSTLATVAGLFAALYGWLLPLDEAPLVQRWLYEIQGYNVELLLTRPQAAVALVIGAIAIVTFSPTLSSDTDGRQVGVPAFALLRSCAFSGQIVAICVVAAVQAWGRSSSSAAVNVPAAGWFLGILLFGVALGFCFTLFIGAEQSASRIFVATIGTVTFGAGVGAELGVSSMFINLVTGATVGLTLRDRGALQGELRRLQHPISVLLLLLAGALWVPPERPLLWLFPVLYVPVRWIARLSWPSIWTRALSSVEPTRIGSGLLGQGTLAVAVAVDYAL
jgi:hypothetical protein